MKSGNSKVALLPITEHIEMELLSLEEPCVVVLTQEEEEEHSFNQVSLLLLFYRTWENIVFVQVSYFMYIDSKPPRLIVLIPETPGASFGA